MSRLAGALVALVSVGALLGCEDEPGDGPAARDQAEPPPAAGDPAPRPRGTVTLGFAGDVHFEWHLAALLDGSPRGRLGPITAALRKPDLTMVNLESAITRRGTAEPKEFTFRTSPKALDVLAAAGVDVVSMANNHGVDYGAVGLRDTLAAVDASPVPVVGIGRNADEAFRPHRTRVGATDIAVFAVSQRPEETAANWPARESTPGIAVSIRPRPRLLNAVRRADEAGQVVVVYLHWGRERHACPVPLQREMAAALAAAGADVVVGSHAHVLLGSGWLDRTYVSYGLGNFVWYNTYRPHSGVLAVRIREGRAVGHAFTPVRIRADGLPYPKRGRARAAAMAEWEQLQGCAGLADSPGPASP